MDTVTLAILLGVGIFIACLVILVSLLRLRARKQESQALKKSFGRHHIPEGVGIHDVRKAKVHETIRRREGKGRFYLFAALVAGIFGVLLARLWSIQLLSGDTYMKLAEQNMTSDVSIPATRGRLLDRKGRELVGNRPSMTVAAARSVLEDRNIIHRLSLVLGIPVGVLRRALLDDTVGAQSDRILAQDASMRSISYIREHPGLFAGVTVEERTVRSYSYGTAAAHLLGYIGPVTETDLLVPNENIAYESGDYIGKSGAELAFESLLQGIRGTRTYRVDVDGNPTALLSEVPPVNGSDVCLTIDLDLQRRTDRILSDVITSSRERGFEHANAGAIIVLDLADGGVRAMSSYPGFRPEEFTNGISQDLWDQMNSTDSGYPLTNRAIAGLYPAASTYKVFSGLAGQKYGIIKEDTHFTCNGIWTEYGEAWGQRCWVYPGGHGSLNFEEAINQSCDIYFYNVGASFYERWSGEDIDEDRRENPLQSCLKSWGFGSPCGIDLPGEMDGRVPDAAWKKQTFADTPEDARWQPGDMTSLCIGQGDLLVTPLQLVNGYAGIAREKMLVPHVFDKVIDGKGETVIAYAPEESPVQPSFDAAHIARVKDGLKRMAARSGRFDHLPVAAASKTGTAEVISAKAETVWFVAYAPFEKPEYCVVCVIEQGGEGSSSAQLGVEYTFAALYGVDLGEIIVSEGSRER
ncbi:MAG: penicillin-binding protein 2 [Coriobacteriales bacterium]|jgi:penicillin-binding protein 2|nr:penicillin-binding protein 2 [Coriobacteriales bacterium]